MSADSGARRQRSDQHARRQHRSVAVHIEVNDVVISAVQQQPSDEILRRGRASSTVFILMAPRRRA